MPKTVISKPRTDPPVNVWKCAAWKYVATLVDTHFDICSMTCEPRFKGARVRQRIKFVGISCDVKQVGLARMVAPGFDPGLKITRHATTHADRAFI